MEPRPAAGVAWRGHESAGISWRVTKQGMTMTLHTPLLALLAALALSPQALANDWPVKPVKILVPFAPGGSADGTARMVAQHLGDTFRQTFVVENQGGASGAIAAQTVARAAPDGYTLFWGTSIPIAVAPVVAKTSYDPVKDFAPISIVGTNPFVLLTNAGLPAGTLAEFIEVVRKQPRALSYGAAGGGSITHMLMALFLKRANLEMIPVMYRGSAPAMTDVIGGHIKALMAPLPLALPYLAGGPVRLIAVSSEQRHPQMPAVPTFIESGFPGFTGLTWNGLMAPAGTPRAIVDRIAGEIARLVRDPKAAEALTKNGVDPLGNTPEEFAAFIAADIALWTEAVKVVGPQ
jgi:tripartite-type tricarboxylate transporter receptor subunit TctC